MQHKISEFRKMQLEPTQGPSHLLGTSIIQGIAKGRSRSPDSPESAGFFDATKKAQVKTAAADTKKNPAAIAPPRETFSKGIIGLPPNDLAHERLSVGRDSCYCKNRDCSQSAGAAIYKTVPATPLQTETSGHPKDLPASSLAKDQNCAA
jgi:hypothetical protein